MNAFNVWLRFLRDICRVRVDEIENAKWLLDRLSQSGNVRISAQFGTMEKLSVKKAHAQSPNDAM